VPPPPAASPPARRPGARPLHFPAAGSPHAHEQKVVNAVIRRSSALTALVLALATAGCAPEHTYGDSAEVRAPVGPQAVMPTETAAAGMPRPREIYYDLTAFEWYRQGQPLMIAGRAFVPVGRPEAIRDRPLDLAGEYGGVAYYVQRGSSPGTGVLVPVFEGYWQPFLPAAAATELAE
jgi:hypothetical protein